MDKTPPNLLRLEIGSPCVVSHTCIGIDPGTVNLGIAIITKEGKTILYQIKLVRSKQPQERIYLAHDMVSEIIKAEFLLINDDSPHAVIEGAAFGEQHRQPELAEQRAAIALALRPIPVTFIGPTSVRKMVWGSGKITASDQYPDYPKDAAAALGCALAAHRRE